MERVRLLQLAVLACVSHIHVSGFPGYMSFVFVEPQSPRLQIGTNFTATCVIRNTTALTVDDLRWRLRSREIPVEHYTKVNATALSVTFTVTEETPDWLYCSPKRDWLHFVLRRAEFEHGIFLQKGYFPEKPKNLFCLATQAKDDISPIIRCQWETRHRKAFNFRTTYRLLLFRKLSNKSQNVTTEESSAAIDTETFPNFMPLDFWVEAENELGKVESEHLYVSDANDLVKTNPPSWVDIISEDGFPTSLLLNWTRPLNKRQIHLIYEIRFSPSSSHSWSTVPPAETRLNIQSFRLQDLRPFTDYAVQVRCKNQVHGVWSEWSENATQRTPPFKPTSKPDLWHTETSADGRLVRLFTREPEVANGVISEYRIRIQEFQDRLQLSDSEWQKIPVDTSRGTKQVTALKEVHLSRTTRLAVKVIAINSVGESPEASLGILEEGKDLPPVQQLKVSSVGGKLFVEWNAPNDSRISEFVLQWASSGYLDWQRENSTTRNAIIRGDLEDFVRYNVSVYALYSGWLSKPAHLLTYLRQGAPLEGPSKITSQPGCTHVLLTWQEIPLSSQRGFITNYTIFYTTDDATRQVSVPGDRLSHRLTHLTRNSRYNIVIKAWNKEGSKEGVSHSFTTLKYAPMEMESIVVGVSLCFLFVVVLTMLICVCKRDIIKKSLWPEIPNPGESTIGSWSPDYPLKAETPSENCLSGISVLDVDVDGKSVFEEDKSCLPLKKDKYLSEEHSSGIGGSSCMSSPRQSVSDSDEGGDMADTTASTVQYSSVVASSGYKGQTPSLQPQQAVFSRSESTQPLLECEENPDILSLEGSRQLQRAPHLTHSEGSCHSPHQLEMEAKTLDFCPVEEDCEEVTSADDQPQAWRASGPMSSYMPQLGGYRPQ